MLSFIQSLAIFILAGFCEIGGGYLVWKWLKEDKPLWYGLLGGLILFAYGVVATWQTQNFGRVYATYGGIFIVMSLIFACKLDSYTPDKYDLIGSAIALIGVLIIYYAPRT